MQQLQFAEPIMAQKDTISREIVCEFGKYNFISSNNVIVIITNNRTVNPSLDEKIKVKSILNSLKYSHVFCDSQNKGIYFSASTYKKTDTIRFTFIK